jgi:hypothetical protein
MVRRSKGADKTPSLRRRGPRYHHLAEYYARLGEKDKAFECLETSVGERAWMMMFLRVDPRFDPLRGDPRFDALVRRVEEINPALENRTQEVRSCTSSRALLYRK